MHNCVNEVTVTNERALHGIGVMSGQVDLVGGLVTVLGSGFYKGEPMCWESPSIHGKATGPRSVGIVRGICPFVTLYETHGITMVAAVYRVAHVFGY